MSGRRALPILIACFGAAAGCAIQYPGEPVGTFEVTGSLEENACGPDAVQALDPVVFQVELRAEGGQAWWRRPNTGLVSGSILTDGTYRFRTQSTRTVIAPNPATQNPGCVLNQRETLEVRLFEDTVATDGGAAQTDAGVVDGGGSEVDAGVAYTGLEGMHHIELSPASGSVCTGALVVAGGPFLALPCSVDYALTGEPVSPY